jgi:hypothetical protein
MMIMPQILIVKIFTKERPCLSSVSVPPKFGGRREHREKKKPQRSRNPEDFPLS